MRFSRFIAGVLLDGMGGDDEPVGLPPSSWYLETSRVTVSVSSSANAARASGTRT